MDSIWIEYAEDGSIFNKTKFLHGEFIRRENYNDSGLISHKFEELQADEQTSIIELLR
jgi:hypothetical protein